MLKLMLPLKLNYLNNQISKKNFSNKLKNIPLKLLKKKN